MHADLVPLIVIESNLVGFDLHFLFAIGQAHGQAEPAFFDRHVEIITAFSWEQS